MYFASDAPVIGTVLDLSKVREIVDSRSWLCVDDEGNTNLQQDFNATT